MSLKQILNDEPASPIHAPMPSVPSTSIASLDPLPAASLPQSPTSAHPYPEPVHWQHGNASSSTKQHGRPRYSAKANATPGPPVASYFADEPRHGDVIDFRGRPTRVVRLPQPSNGHHTEDDDFREQPGSQRRSVPASGKRKRKYSPDADEDYRPPSVKPRVSINLILSHSKLTSSCSVLPAVLSLADNTQRSFILR